MEENKWKDISDDISEIKSEIKDSLNVNNITDDLKESLKETVNSSKSTLSELINNLEMTISDDQIKEDVKAIRRDITSELDKTIKSMSEKLLSFVNLKESSEEE
jgi:uncharacterized membrane-anchored protein YjiN (DUF445 family)|tara:strand:- start:11130 stop:11441 length:312 start_codon:yes stop_codon:yes gene_type:complete